MLLQIVFFIAGIVITAAVCIPLLHLCSRKIRTLENLSAQSDSGSLEFRGRLTELAGAVRESAAAAANQDIRITDNADMKKIENSIDENAQIVAEIADKTGSVAAIAAKMEEDVLKGFAVLEKNVKKMGDIKEKNSGIINGIILLGNKVNKIRDIVRIISTITDQTKVIAFNAALEAASAGESGKRFAVVAGEVNRLADDIAVLTRQIREQVEEIQSSSSSLIIYSEEGSDRISEGHKLIKDLEDIFKEIRSGAEITSNQAQTITVSTRQQLKYSEQIRTAVSEVSGEVKNFINNAEAAAMTALKLTEQTGELERFLDQEEHGH